MTQGSFAMALAGVSFLMTLIWGTPFVRLLRHYRIGEKIQIVGPMQQMSQLGTPTMGGLLFILPIVVVHVILNATSVLGLDIIGSSIFLPVLVFMIFGALGLLMDWRRVQDVPHYPQWLRLLVQILVAAVTAVGLAYVLQVPQMYLPFYPEEIVLGAWYVPAAALLILVMTNAVQVTSGVDGLPGLLMATAFAAYGAIAIIQEQVFVARFAFSVVGALLGFLWFNIKPASLVMGRTGTYSLGAALATVALMTAQWPLILLIAVIPVTELLSVGLHKLSRRAGRRNPFVSAAPLHRLLELNGWSQTQIIQRLWLINLLFAMIGITMALV